MKVGRRKRRGGGGGSETVDARHGSSEKSRHTRDFKLWARSKCCALCLCNVDGLDYPIPVTSEVEGHTGERRRSDRDV